MHNTIVSQTSEFGSRWWCGKSIKQPIPSPGGVGSFHYITRVTLVYLFGVEASLAVTYAVFLHGSQLVFYVIVGFVCIMLQGSSLGTLRRRAQAVQEQKG